MDFKILDLRIGRTNRGQFILSFVIIPVLAIPLIVLPEASTIKEIGNIVYLSCYLYITSLLVVRRLRDIGLNDKIAALWFITFIAASYNFAFAIINLLFLLPLIFWPGENKRNKYGEQPVGFDPFKVYGGK